MRYKLSLSYDGSAFSGWQVQNNAPSVQGALQDTLSILLSEKIEVTGAGRTDAGVHASFYVAHFDCNGPVDTGTLLYKLNSMLPKQIAVFSVEEVPDSFHARFSAVSRQYKYHIHSEKDPFRNAYSWYCRFPLDLEEMNKACAFLLGAHDCSCFEKTGSDNTNSICEICSAHWEKDGENSIVFTIEANRFLRNMVRAIVGTMVDIGRGVHDAGWIASLLEKGTRSDAGQSVPGHALFLSDIKY